MLFADDEVHVVVSCLRLHHPDQVAERTLWPRNAVEERFALRICISNCSVQVEKDGRTVIRGPTLLFPTSLAFIWTALPTSCLRMN